MDLSKHADFRQQLAICRDYMSERYKVWERLDEKYNLRQMTPHGISAKDVVPVPRFYALARQIIASIAFHYPKVFLKVEEDEAEPASTVLERLANQALELMGVREEVWQVIFDALFCGVGWLEMGYNPPGDDAIAPYVANDVFEEDFPYCLRLDPHTVFIDPLTPPHRFGAARFIIVERLVPLDKLKEERIVRGDTEGRRYSHTANLQAMGQGGPPGLGADPDGVAYDDAQSRAAVEGNMIRIYVVHDRMERRMITFAEGEERPIENVPHPFGNIQTEDSTDMFGQTRRTPTDQNAPGFLLENGFNLLPLKFDASATDFWPELPPMAYVEGFQDIQTESVSRRRGLLRRYARVIFANHAELQANPSLAQKVRTAKDGDVIGVTDVANFLDPQFGSPPNDQLGIEADARQYEESTLNVTEFLQGGGPKRTATEAALISSAGGLNREWMQVKIALIYEDIVKNTLQMMGDPRYFPDRFILNVAPEGEGQRFELLQQWPLLKRFRVDVEAGSMQPLVEQLERDDTLQFVDRAVTHFGDLIDRVALFKQMASAFRIPDPDKILTQDDDADTIKAIQLENVGWLRNGQDPGVTPGEDHDAHIQGHTEDAGQYQQEVQAQGQGDPLRQQQAGLQLQQVLAAYQQHIAAHQQAQEQEAQQLGGGGAPAAPSGPTDLVGQVQSNAQATADAVQGGLDR